MSYISRAQGSLVGELWILVEKQDNFLHKRPLHGVLMVE